MMTLSKMRLSIIILSTMTLSSTLNNVMLSVIMMSVANKTIMLIVAMPRALILSVIKLSVVAPF